MSHKTPTKMTPHSAGQAGSSGIWEPLGLSLAAIWMVLLAVLLMLLLLGCTRTVLVPESSPLRAGSDMEGYVYTLVEGEWRLSSNKVKIPEGWYFVPPSYVEEPK